MKYTTVFLDLDDTILNTQKNSAVCLEEIYNDYNIEKYYSTFEEFSKVYFVNNRQLWYKYEMGDIDKATLLKGRFVNPFKPFDDLSEKDILDMNDDYLNRIVFQNTHIEGAVDLLDYLKAKYKILIISNGFSELQYKKIENAGLSSYFDKIILSDEVGVNKPHPDIFTFALKEASSRREEAIMVGDSPHSDIVGAYNSGINQVWFNPEDQKIDNIVPTYTIKNLSEIKDIL